MQIESGTGNGAQAKVTDENMLRAYAMIEQEISHESEHAGAAFSWVAVSADIDVNDTMLYLVNNSTIEDLVVQKIILWVDVDTEVDIGFPTTYVTPAGGTVVTGTNLNQKSGRVALATARADETANSIGVLYHTARILTAVGEVVIETNGSIVLGYHDAIQCDVKTEPTGFNATIIGYYHSLV